MHGYKVNDYVFVNPDRGITPSIARVIRIFDNEAEIMFDNGSKEIFYFVHLYQTRECFLRKTEFLRERANKVGK
jgi:hypothetical protein